MPTSRLPAAAAAALAAALLLTGTLLAAARWRCSCRFAEAAPGVYRCVQPYFSVSPDHASPQHAAVAVRAGSAAAASLSAGRQ